MSTIRVTALLNGKTPIMFERMTEEAIDNLPGGIKTQKTQRPADFTARNVADLKLYRDGEGHVGVPAEMVFAALKRAGRRVGYGTGKTKVSTADTTYLPEFFTLTETFYPFSDLDEHGNIPWDVDKRRGVNPATKGAMCIIRPKINKWQLAVTFEYDDALFNQQSMKALFRLAGTGSGLGAFRPSCGGPFGCFTVGEWKEEKLVTEGTEAETSAGPEAIQAPEDTEPAAGGEPKA